MNIKGAFSSAVDHGDAGRKIIISEFGYFDSYLERREELIADVCVPAIVALTERLQTIESVYMFRMFNWTSAGSAVVETEQTYGIFDSPMQPLGVRPKPVNTNNRNEIYCFMILCYSRLIHYFISYTYTMDPDLTPPH